MLKVLRGVPMKSIKLKEFESEEILKSTSVRLKPEQIKQLKKENKNISELVRWLIDQYFEQKEK